MKVAFSVDACVCPYEIVTVKNEKFDDGTDKSLQIFPSSNSLSFFRYA